MPVDRIGRSDLPAVLTRIWGMRQESALRVRLRIRAALSWAQAHGYFEQIDADEHIDGALPKMSAAQLYFLTLPYQDVSAALGTGEAPAVQMAVENCFQFLIQGAARSGEERGAA